MSTAPAVGALAAHDVRWRVVGACGVVAACGSGLYYVSSGPLKGRAWELTIVGLLALMAVGIWRFQAGNRLAWSMLWLGLTSAFVGGFLASHPGLSPFDVNSPSVIDAMRLGNYPLAAAGVLLLVFRRDRRVGSRALLEAAIAVGAGSLLIWVLVLDPLIVSSRSSGIGSAVALMYPLGDVLLLGVLAVLIVHVNGCPGSLVLVALALMGNLAADIAFSYQNLNGGYQPGGLIDVGWLLCFASLALAPSWPIATAPRLVGDDGRLHAGRLGFLAAGALLAPGIALAQRANGGQPGSEVLGAVVGLFLLVLVRIVVFNRDLDKSRTAIATLADQLTVTNRDLEIARSDQRRLLDRIHRAVEDERTRIAADIHDRPLQHLAGIGYQLERVNVLLRRGDTAGASSVCDQATSQLSEQLGELRVLMTDIRPPVLDERGLVGALRDRAAQIHEAHPELATSVDGTGERVHRDIETTLYRVAQEALQNVLCHAQATSVVVRVATGDDQAVLSVTDDGRGFAPPPTSELIRSGRFGVTGMRERVEMLGGSMTIESLQGIGTTVTFRVPTSSVRNHPGSLLETAG